jgi:hypothetical protein
MLPTELQDKIFLYLSCEELEKSRELQNNYIKVRTKFGTLTDVIKNINTKTKYTGINNIKWLLKDPRVDPTVHNNEIIRDASNYG